MKIPFVTLIWLILTSLLSSGCGILNSAEIYQVGLLSGVDVFNTTLDGFKAEMVELGYVEGENIVYDLKFAGGDAAAMKQISEQFVDDGADLIVTTTNGAALAAQAATAGTGVPVVFTIVLAPQQTGVVHNLREPGANITGVRNPLEDFIGKRVEILVRLDPEVRRIWVPYNPRYVTVNVVLERLRQVAPSLGVELVETPVDTPEDLLAALATLRGRAELDIDAIVIMPDLTVQLPESWSAMLDFAKKNKLPIVANTRGQVQDGALFAYLSDNVETGRLAAPLADKILQGNDPATIPVATSEPRLIINYQTSQTLNLTIAEGLLAQAIEVIR
jgi:putative ABC transport system substrate-binding protein